MNVDSIGYDIESKIISASIDHSAANAAAGHPDRESSTVVIATVVYPRGLALSIGVLPNSPPQITKRLVEHTAGFRSLTKAALGDPHLERSAHAFGQAAVMIHRDDTTAQNVHRARASRRANRQLRANVPGLLTLGHDRRRVSSVSPARSMVSGTLVCMR